MLRLDNMVLTRMKTMFPFIAVFVLASQLCAAAADDSLQDHFALDENIDDSFAWTPGAACKFWDAEGVVLHSNWMQRHWVKNAGKQTEFNGEVMMSDEGWFQTFVAPDLTVTLRLPRLAVELEGTDSAAMAGEIDIIRSGQSTTYQVTGACSA